MDIAFTTKSQEALGAAVRLAAANGNAQVEPLHILDSLLQQGPGIASALLEAVGADHTRLTQQVRAAVSALPSAAGASVSAPQMGAAAYRSITEAKSLADQRGDEYVSTEHLLIGLAKAGGPEVTGLLQAQGATEDALLAALDGVRGGARVTTQDPEQTFQALEKYGVDLTARAREGKIDPVIGFAAQSRCFRGEPRTTRY